MIGVITDGDVRRAMANIARIFPGSRRRRSCRAIRKPFRPMSALRRPRR
ncbi:MAG: hypothetical protein ACLUEV_06770 [Alistipes sp.]